MHDTHSLALATVLSIGWFALAFAWFVRWTGLGRIVLRFWRDSGAFARIASVAALVALSVYGGSKSGGSNGLGGAGTFMVPRPLANPGIAQPQSSGTPVWTRIDKEGNTW